MSPSDSCWKAVKGFSKLGTLGMIQKGRALGFSRQVLADVFGAQFVLKALGTVEGEDLREPSWR